MPIMHTSTLPNGAVFSSKHALKPIRFIEKVAVHTKSKWARKPFVLEPWQRGSATLDENTGLWKIDGIVAPVFGTLKYSDFWGQKVRQFQEVWIELARKNGKSELIAALALYLLIYDGEWSAEIIGAAADKRQASMVFNAVRDMIRLSKVLSAMVDNGELEVIDSRKRIIYRPTMSIYEVVSADVMSNLGANPHAVIIDEVLAQPNRDLWDALAQGFGTRPNQILIGITTAGPDRESFAYTEHTHSLRVAKDPNIDPRRFVYVAYVDEEADYEDETFWPEANPGLGSFLNIEQLRAELKTAKEKGDLAAVNNFRIFRLNQWGNDANRWLDLVVWDESENIAGSFDDSDLSGVSGTGGLDLADTRDLVSWVIVWTKDNRTMIKPHFWVPEKALETKHRKMKYRFKEWAEQGHLTIVRGEAHDYEKITEHILHDIETYNIRNLGFDPHQAPAIINQIESKTDTVCVKIPQTTTRMNPGAQELTRLMGNRALTANKNPMLRWNASNANYKQDSEGKIKPDKLKSRDPIDGITALVVGLAVHVGMPEASVPQFWAFEDEDLYGEED